MLTKPLTIDMGQYQGLCSMPCSLRNGSFNLLEWGMQSWGGESVKGPIPPSVQIPVIRTIFSQLHLPSKLPLSRYKHWQTMHIIKVEYILINVCFCLLIVVVTIRRCLVIGLENSNKDAQIPTEKQLRSMARRQCWTAQSQPWEAEKNGG